LVVNQIFKNTLRFNDMFKKIFFIYLAITLFSCEKASKNPVNLNVKFTESKAIGEPIIREIDEMGGVIDINIANARLVFPQSSVLKSTTVSVQAITNSLSNYGLGIRLSSEYKNVKIEFKYPLNGLEPELFDIFYAQGLGWAKSKNKTIDKINNTISIIQISENSTSITPSSRVATHVYDYVLSK
jgi:uncharacterized protein YuzE